MRRVPSAVLMPPASRKLKTPSSGGVLRMSTLQSPYLPGVGGCAGFEKLKMLFPGEGKMRARRSEKREEE